MGVTLKDVKELSNPSSPLEDQLFIASTNIHSWQRVSDINGKVRKKKKDKARRRGLGQAKRDREEREKQLFDTIMLPLHQDAGQLKIYRVCILLPSST
jgi:hypothetical protein